MCSSIEAMDYFEEMEECWERDASAHVEAYYWHMQTVGCSDNYRYVVEV